MNRDHRDILKGGGRFLRNHFLRSIDIEHYNPHFGIGRFR
jgi:hypothetical protein